MRLRYALAALAFAAVILAARPAWACTPLCGLYDVWDPLYYYNSCWNCPPNPPEG